MREKPSEWIAISDLMAGVVAVVMLLLVVSVLKIQSADTQGNQDAGSESSGSGTGGSKERDCVAELMQKLDRSIRADGLQELMSIDQPSGRLTLREGAFKRSSACLDPGVIACIDKVKGDVRQFFECDARTHIAMEGHTDSTPVKKAVCDEDAFCAAYDDNYTLSAARARQARKALIDTLGDAGIAGRVEVAGFGESRPLPDASASEARNRRVEIRFYRN